MIKQTAKGDIQFVLTARKPAEQIREAMLDRLRFAWLIFKPTGKDARRLKQQAKDIKTLPASKLRGKKHLLQPYKEAAK